MFLVISNIDTCVLPKTFLSFSSALIMGLLMASCSLFFLMYPQTFFTTSVRGSGMAPTTAASMSLGVIAFMKPALGVRFTAGLVGFLVGAAPSSRLVFSRRASWHEASSLWSYSDLLFWGCTLTVSGNTPLNLISQSRLLGDTSDEIVGIIISCK